MPSKEAIDYCKSIGNKDGRYYVCGNLEEDVECSDQIMAAFDAGVESVNKRIGEVNDYYDQLSGMSEDYQAGYIQAEKDMPKQFEAVHDIIMLQKEVDILKLENEKLVEKLKSRLLQDEIENKA